MASLEAASLNARDVGLVRSVMAAGFYPLVSPSVFSSAASLP